MFADVNPDLLYCQGVRSHTNAGDAIEGHLGAMWLGDHARHWTDATFKEYVIRKELATLLDVAVPIVDCIHGARLDGLVQWKPGV